VNETLSSRREALERHTRLDYRSPGEALSQGPGKEAKLCFVGHALMEKRNGLLVDICLTPADGHAEHVAALHMIKPRADRPQAITPGLDNAYDAEDFVNESCSMKVTPQANRRSLRLDQDGRRTRADQVSRMRSRRPGLHLCGRRLQFDAAAEAAGGVGMNAAANCQLFRRRRIVDVDICDLATCAGGR
jgi:hypothetical protein